MNLDELSNAFGRLQQSQVDLQNELARIQKADSLKVYDDTKIWRRITEMEKDILIIQTQIRELGKRRPPKEEAPERRSWDIFNFFK